MGISRKIETFLNWIYGESDLKLPRKNQRYLELVEYNRNRRTRKEG